MRRIKLQITVDVPDNFQDDEAPISYEEDGVQVSHYEVHFREVEAKRKTSIQVTTSTPDYPETQELTLPKQTLESVEGPIRLFQHINNRLEQAANTRPVNLTL